MVPTLDEDRQRHIGQARGVIDRRDRDARRASIITARGIDAWLHVSKGIKLSPIRGQISRMDKLCVKVVLSIESRGASLVFSDAIDVVEWDNGVRIIAKALSIYFRIMLDDAGVLPVIVFFLGQRIIVIRLMASTSQLLGLESATLV